MVLGLLGAWFGHRERMPADRVTRTPRAAKKAAAGAIAGMQQALEQIGALPGIADVKQQRRVPRGFFALLRSFYTHYDEYHAVARRHLPIVEQAKRKGEPGGTAACYEVPMGVHAVEAINIFRTTRLWRDFPEVARQLGEQGEQLFKDIQAGHTGKDPEKIRMGGKAVRQGRLTAARRLVPCPLLDQGKDRCRIWDDRPVACRMHIPTTPPEWSRPDHEQFPRGIQAFNIRPPVRVQVLLTQLDKRMMLQNSPFLPASILQMLELGQGQVIQEAGEAPLRMQQDGSVAQRANRNVKHAKKFQKDKAKGKRGARK